MAGLVKGVRIDGAAVAVSAGGAGVRSRGRPVAPPGRVFAAARSHTFGQLADAIDTAFARWDPAHMHMFTLADATQITTLEQWDGDAPDGSIDSDTTKLGKLDLGDQFAYVFDFGDDWTHLCTVEEQKIDPDNTVGVTPAAPTAYWGWGDLPDQYGRRWDGDDGESRPPKLPTKLLADLPPILPWWGAQHRR